MTEKLAAKNKENIDSLLLPENLRQQYLKSMGIQSWFDPSLEVPVNESVTAQVAQKETVKPVVVDAFAQESLMQVKNHQPESLQESPNPAEAIESLEALSVKISQCELCELHINRQQAISGEGDANAKVFIIIDAPIDDSGGDSWGDSGVDSSGDSASENALFNVADKLMLQAMLQAIGCQLSSVFITSLVKCRPAEQRAPQTSEMICCDDHLSAQIKLIQPDVILVLGEQASQQLLVSQKSLTDLRLRHHKHLGIAVYASYHPRDMFNSAQTKRKVWADLLQIKQHI